MSEKVPLQDERLFRLACLLFFVSGAIALLYELIWLRILTLQFGISAWSVSTVVASFMAGLSAGSFTGRVWADRIRRPLRVYAWLELAIALFGVLSLPLLLSLDLLIAPLYHALEGQFVWFSFARFLLAFVVLILPTFLMGFSFPVLAAGLAEKESFQRRVSWFYGLNTLGGAAGVLLAGFFLLPQLGRNGSLFVTVGAGLALAAAAFAGDKMLPAARLRRPDRGPEPPRDTAAPALDSLVLAMLIAGALGMMYEIAWARLLAPVFGSSTYAFSIILLTYLVGIGLGGLLAARFAPKKAHRVGVAFCLGLSALTVLPGLSLVDQLPGWFTRLAHASGDRVWLLFLVQGLLASSLIALPTLGMGAALPLAAAGWRQRTGQSGRAIGGIYAANTLGAIVGTVLIGFVLLPRFGAARSIQLAAAAGFVLALGLLLTERCFSVDKRVGWSTAALLLGGVVFLMTPTIDQSALQRGQFRQVLGLTRKGYEIGLGGDLLYTREGLSATVSVYRDSEQTCLKINGKTDASTGQDSAAQYLLGHLPLFLTPRARQVCVIGYGSGATVRAVATHPGISRLDVVELEPAVIGASPYFETINDNVLQDARVRLFLEDGRTFLRYREARYDVIISEPSNPWIAGVANLFSEEFYRIVKARLSPDGRFCQWIQAYELSNETLNGMLSTLAKVFEHLLIFRWGSDLICIGTDRPIVGKPAAFERRMRIPGVSNTLRRIRIKNPYELFFGLLAVFPADRKKYVGQIVTDDRQWLEFRAPLEMYRGAEIGLEMPDAREYLDRISRSLFPGLDRSQLALRLAHAIERLSPRAAPLIDGMVKFSQPEKLRKRLSQLAASAKRRWNASVDAPSQLREAEQFLRKGQGEAASSLLRQVLTNQPENGKAHRLLGAAHWQSGRRELAIREFRMAIRLQTLDYLAQTQLGTLLSLQVDQQQEGQDRLQRALEINPYHVRAWSAWIASLVRRGQFSQARSAQAEAKRILPVSRFRELERQLEKLQGTPR